MALHATAVGKACMEVLEPRSALRGLPLPRYTANTVVKLPELRRHLLLKPEPGWSADAKEHKAGISCYGAVIRGSRGMPVVAISGRTVVFRQTADPEAGYVGPLLDVCLTIAAHIAGSPLPGPFH